MSERAIFFLAVLLLAVAYSIVAGSIGKAVGSLVLVVPVSIALGAIALWLGQQIAGFARGVRQTSAQARTPVSVWRRLTLSLLIGISIWLLVSRSY
ncbi:MAG: hypothetical protein OZ948_15110 [Deltaproteobacteria bacterium]|nr:hypothetical protein [Deltaproteobacteria bacterium]